MDMVGKWMREVGVVIDLMVEVEKEFRRSKLGLRYLSLLSTTSMPVERMTI